MKTKTWKVGDQAIAEFKRHDGTMYRKRGLIYRLWGKKKPYAVDFLPVNGQGIRICIDELRPVKP